ncbi:MAG TPA: hypothetical protein VG713_15015 [Pirellulales bacterium]|nr:hypothetical protein [Pirellulales bacterium]
MAKRRRRHRDWGRPYGESETGLHQLVIGIALLIGVAVGLYLLVQGLL